MEIFDTVIVGSGPAGYCASLYASRACLKTLLIEGDVPGGQLMSTSEVENYLGFSDIISGPELMDCFAKHGKKFGTQVKQDRVTRIDCSKRPFRLFLGSGESVVSKSIILCTGASAKSLGLENEKKFYGVGISGCATCDGFFYKGKKVAVVGGGSSAAEEALFLSRYASEIVLIHRRETLSCEKILEERLKKNKKITFLWNTVVKDFLGQAPPVGLTHVVLEDKKTHEVREVEFDGVFVAIGHTPNTDFLQNQVNLDHAGYIVTKPFSTETSILGIFAAGDVQDSLYRQAITSAGTGCIAALEVERFLSSED